MIAWGIPYHCGVVAEGLMSGVLDPPVGLATGKGLGVFFLVYSSGIFCLLSLNEVLKNDLDCLVGRCSDWG